jgi:hypothetical protein
MNTPKLKSPSSPGWKYHGNCVCSPCKTSGPEKKLLDADDESDLYFLK